MIGVWIEFANYLILLALFVLVFMRGSFTTLHRIYLLFHMFMLNWPLGQTVLYMADPPEYRMYIMKMMYVCLAVLGYGWFVFAVFLTGRSYVYSRFKLFVSAIPSILVAAAVMINPYHWFIKETGTRLTEADYGPFFWLLVAVLCGYMARAIQLMRGAIHHSGCVVQMRKQVQMALRGLILFLLFGVIDICVNVIFEFTGYVVPGLMSLGMTLSGLYFVIAIKRNRLFDLVQFAQQDVFNSMSSGIIVVNEQGNVADINRVMQPVMPFRVGDKFDIRVMLSTMRAVSEQSELFIEWHEANSPERLEMEVLVPSFTTAKRHVVIASAPIKANNDETAGRIITIQDVTDYRLLMEETRRQNETLQDQNQELLMMQDELSAANRKLERMAVIDSLTGCFNRRYLLSRLESELPSLAMIGKPVSVLLFDIDLFKNVNDTYGHLVGDMVLVQTADTIRGMLGPNDVLARYGGEEFTVYMPGADMKLAAEAAERIRSAVERSELFWNDEGMKWNGPAEREAAAGRETDHAHHQAGSTKKLSVTISMGVVADEAVQPENVIESAAYLRQLFASADEALYVAKHAGRNQVVCRHFRTNIEYQNDESINAST
ncbi:diguanylate cyclase (GGDEF)-like protein [Paenibacillus cellulosilyticus]|uniref:Diguanylate cyclase (GGDEF)-like protein n=1 Tax=Paenibacillus cellulosilyticus TaxID=375489 RepID=A0A2V2YL20_9BACL|nr:diguanylate cyclase [Paenibacillus cellulosilyticus]PWV94239.1 diguanylate cyclase (GGDEF)-like protein [Paenibacillus cellulosilyticus]QKS44268.1 diguanylate cyclase [Paenibacillus cellulosilyticus]